MAKLTEFGKTVKKRLVDMDQKQNWLIDEVKNKTGLYFDSSYLHKILDGRLSTPSIMQAICDILDISMVSQHESNNTDSRCGE